MVFPPLNNRSQAQHNEQKKLSPCRKTDFYFSKALLNQDPVFQRRGHKNVNIKIALETSQRIRAFQSVRSVTRLLASLDSNFHIDNTALVRLLATHYRQRNATTRLDDTSRVVAPNTVAMETTWQTVPCLKSHNYGEGWELRLECFKSQCHSEVQVSLFLSLPETPKVFFFFFPSFRSPAG